MNLSMFQGTGYINKFYIIMRFVLCSIPMRTSNQVIKTIQPNFFYIGRKIHFLVR